MKQYSIDQLGIADHAAIQSYLERNYPGPGLEGLYWVPLATDLLTDLQRAHADCQPHYVALELLPDRLVCELLVRSRLRMRCDCMAYADRRQRNWLIDLADGLLSQLGVTV
jgi:hypothetical protein